MKATRARLEELTKQAATAPAPATPIAAARLEKLHQEIALLTHRVRTADLERRAMERELLFAEEARELLTAAVSPLVERLRTLPKGLAPRLVGQPQKAVEQALLAAVNDLLELGRMSIQRFNAKVGGGREL